MDLPRSLVLKLHGSLNWRVRLGELASLGPTALVHHSPWLQQFVGFASAADFEDQINSHLEAEPFIVPPVLAKDALAEHPVLRVVWTAARKKLSEASRVVFLGYSLPVTDLAARTLFGETIGNRSVDIRVVDYTPDGAPNSRLIEAYRSLFKDMPETSFDFGGAGAWIARETRTQNQDG